MLDRFRRGEDSILGDGPGLGKRVQALELIRQLLAGETRADGGGPLRILVVRPKMYAERWAALVAASGIPEAAWEVEGPKSNRETQLGRIQSAAYSVQVLFVASRTASTYPLELSTVDWDLVVFDCAAALRPGAAQLTRRCAVGLVSNALAWQWKNMRKMVNTVSPGALDTEAGFKTRFLEPIGRARQASAVGKPAMVSYCLCVCDMCVCWCVCW